MLPIAIAALIRAWDCNALVAWVRRHQKGLLGFAAILIVKQRLEII